MNPSGNLLDRAAKGDPAAQSELADFCLASIEAGKASASDALVFAKMAARLAAAHGAPKHRHGLADLLLRHARYSYDAGNFARGAGAHAEALAILNELADEGDEEAERQLLDAAEDSPPELVAFAAKMKRVPTVEAT